jgi:hypothetical protein
MVSQAPGSISIWGDCAKGDSVQMTAAILFCISIVALGQFGLYYWRATIANTSRQQVSDRVRIAAGIQTPSATSRDFRAILNVLELTPDLGGSGSAYRAIRAYYVAVEKIGSLIPAVTGWAETEMDTCSRYMAVMAEQHFARNMDCAVKVRGI